MLNDPTQIANFERPNGAARAAVANPSKRTVHPAQATPRRDWAIAAGLLSLIVLAVGFAVRPQLSASRLASLEYPPIIVSVSGEVHRPGTYEMPWGSRSKDAIQAAGGITNAAEASLINPASQLEDGEQLLVPGKTATNPEQAVAGKAVSGERINLNTATIAQLEVLPGVGPKFAARLVAGRPYSNFEDLDRVRGVGPKMLEKLKTHVRF